MKRKKSFSQEELRYLKLLAQQYPTVQAASSEIINLQAILNLPKGTEHFISDVQRSAIVVKSTGKTYDSFRRLCQVNINV